MIRSLLRLACLLLVFAALPAAAQNCSMSIGPTLEFGTQVGLPTPGTAVTVDIDITCIRPSFIDGIRVCVGINAGTGTGSLVGNRQMSISTPEPGVIGYGLFQDPAHSTPFGETGVERRPVVFGIFEPLVNTQTVTVYGLLTAGQTGKSVGNYLSTLTVTASAQTYFVFPPSSCASSTGVNQTGTFQAHFLLNPACTIAAAPLHFGTVTALTGHDATSNLSVSCTRNGAFSIALDGGTVAGDVMSRQMRLGAGPDTVGYQLYRDSGRTLVWGNTAGELYTGTGTGDVESVPVFGRVPAQGPKPAGTYTDTVTATITF